MAIRHYLVSIIRRRPMPVMSWRPDLWSALRHIDYARLHLCAGRPAAAIHSLLEANTALARASLRGDVGPSWRRLHAQLVHYTQQADDAARLAPKAGGQPWA